MRAAYYGLKCTREKVRAIFLPLSFSLSLCTHSRTHTLAHLPSIFRIGKVGQLHVSYASTFVPTHTLAHTCTYFERMYIVCTWNTHVPHSRTHVPLLTLCLCQHISHFCFCFFYSPFSSTTLLHSISLSLSLCLLFQLDSWPLAIIELASFASFRFFLFAMKNKYVSGSHRIIVFLCHEIQRSLNKHPPLYTPYHHASTSRTPSKGYLVPLFLKCLINGPLFALKKLFLYCVKLQLKWASTLALGTEEGGGEEGSMTIIKLFVIKSSSA